MITDYNMFNFSKIKEIGYVFKCFYELHTDKIYDDTLMYSLGFNGYMDCLKGLQQNIIERKNTEEKNNITNLKINLETILSKIDFENLQALKSSQSAPGFARLN